LNGLSKIGNHDKNMSGVSDALESYLKERKGLRASTVDTYRRVVRLYLPDWSRFPPEHITRDMVATKHAQIRDLRGHAVANTAMRVFRAIYNYPAAVNEALPPNPTVRLSQTRSWYPERRRRGWVRPHQLRPWYEGVIECDEGNLRDFLTLLLFTGLRRSEAIGLRWEYVDLIDRTLTVPDDSGYCCEAESR
jgi:site-specific recombinase XerD